MSIGGIGKEELLGKYTGVSKYIYHNKLKLLIEYKRGLKSCEYCTDFKPFLYGIRKNRTIIFEDYNHPLGDYTISWCVANRTIFANIFTNFDTITAPPINPPIIRSKSQIIAVRKNVSLPAWMATFADKRGGNCSQVLQDGLMQLFNARRAQ